MSDFDQIPFNAKAFSELRSILTTKKIPNALLFYGKENTRRKEAAFFFAKGCNCLDKEAFPCDQCRSCAKIDSHHHPDIHTITRLKDKKNITISQVRDMGVTLSSKPNEARVRIVIIVDADLMNTQAQNALLKLLEEPPEKTMFILTAQKESLLLPTIISRCRKIRFKPLTEKILGQQLITMHNIDPQKATIYSKTADSDLKRAMRYLNIEPKDNSIDWIKRREWLLKNLALLVKNRELNVSHALSLSHRLCLSPDLMDDTLAIIKTFFRDLIVFGFSPEKIVNLDFSDTFTDISQNVLPVFFFQWLRAFFEVEKRLQSNSSLRLTLDRFFLKLVCNKGTMSYD
ncbi:MAG: DNA polymerase III subunit delta' [Pseudomonadota bacterium]